MLAMPKTKNDLIEALKKENEFKVVSIHKGQALNVAKEIGSLGSKEITVVVTSSR